MKEWPIEWMCKKLNISRASYYKWLHRVPSPREFENEEVLKAVLEVSDELHNLYGSYKMTEAVNKKLEKKYNQKRIARLMCVNDIQSVLRRKKRKIYVKSSPEVAAENILNREFEATRPNEKWCADITETRIPGSSKKVYISTILDLYDRFPVGYSTSLRNDTSLVNESFMVALTEHDHEDTLFHSDRGVHYTRKLFGTQLRENGFTQSMSRVGHCIDNGPMEGFQGFMKEEIFILYEIASVQDFIEAFPKYMHFYIHQRPQKRYKGKTPSQIRDEAYQSAVPIKYPISVNHRIKRYWKEIEEKQNKNLAISL